MPDQTSHSRSSHPCQAAKWTCVLGDAQALDLPDAAFDTMVYAAEISKA